MLRSSERAYCLSRYPFHVVDAVSDSVEKLKQFASEDAEKPVDWHVSLGVHYGTLDGKRLEVYSISPVRKL